MDKFQIYSNPETAEKYITELEKDLTCPYCKETQVKPYGFGPEGYGFKCPTCEVEWKDESGLEKEVEQQQIEIMGYKKREVLDIEKIQRLEAALERLRAAGHDNDCLFCAKKDWEAKQALKGKE